MRTQAVPKTFPSAIIIFIQPNLGPVISLSGCQRNQSVNIIEKMRALEHLTSRLQKQQGSNAHSPVADGCSLDTHVSPRGRQL